MLKPSSTTGQRQRKEEQRVSPTSPGRRFPQGLGVSVPDFYKGVPAFPRRRQEVCAGADRPAEAFFLFGPCTARFSFGKTKRGPRRAPRGGERRSKGAGAVFAAGGNGAERTLRRRQWGAHPPWKRPPGGSQSSRAVDNRPYTSAGSVSGIERETSPERSQSYPSCRIRSSSKAPAPII